MKLGTFKTVIANKETSIVEIVEGYCGHNAKIMDLNGNKLSEINCVLDYEIRNFIDDGYTFITIKQPCDIYQHIVGTHIISGKNEFEFLSRVYLFKDDKNNYYGELVLVDCVGNFKGGKYFDIITGEFCKPIDKEKLKLCKWK